MKVEITVDDAKKVLLLDLNTISPKFLKEVLEKFLLEFNLQEEKIFLLEQKNFELEKKLQAANEEIFALKKTLLKTCRAKFGKILKVTRKDIKSVIKAELKVFIMEIQNISSQKCWANISM